MTGQALGRPYDDSADQLLPGMPAGDPFSGPPLAERLAAVEQEIADENLGRSLASGKKDSDQPDPFKPTIEMKLRALATDRFTTFRAPDGRMYGAHRGNPGRALRHGKPSELMQAIALAYVDRYNSWPNKEAQSAVASYLEATTTTAQPVPVRCHWDRKRLLLDVGDPAETVLALTGRGVHATNQRPVTFRRPPNASALPWPLPASGDLDLLWKLVRVVEADRPIVLALLVMAWLTGLPQPIVLVTGPADAGKTTTARYLLSLIDPVTHQRGGSLPEREDEWKARVAQGRVVFVDNSGHITVKTSDLMCRVATGGELTTRELFTNDGAHVSDLLVPIWLTSIDSGVLRGDLQSRIVPIELQAIDARDRAVLSDLEREQENARPGITRALLDLADKVVGMLPAVNRGDLVHRMTDFNLTLRCIDAILGTDGETRLVSQSAELAGDVLDADPVASALIELIGAPSSEWIGEQASKVAAEKLKTGITAEQLLGILTHRTAVERRGKDWPVTARVLSSRLRQIQPALLQARGVKLTFHRTKAARYWTMERPGSPAEQPEQTETPADTFRQGTIDDTEGL